MNRLVVALLLLLLIPGVSYSATYTLPGDAASLAGTCSAGGNVVNCSSDLSFGNNDIIEISPPVALNIAGDLEFNNNFEINPTGSAADMQVSVAGNVIMNNNAIINADLTVSGSILAGNNGELEGNLVVSGTLSLGNNSTVTGNISAGTVELAQNVLIEGNIEAEDVYISGSNTVVDGNINATGTVVNNGTVTGYVNAPCGETNSCGGDIGEQCDVNDNEGACSGGSSLDHFQLSHSGVALTCESYPVTVTACENAGCSAQYSFTGSIDIAESGNGFSAITANFANSSQTTVNLSITTTGSYTLNTANPTGELPGNPHQCSGGSGDGCGVNAVDTALRFSNEADQVAGDDFQLGLQAIRTDNDTGACAAALSDSHPVTFSLDCLDPASCSDTATFPQAVLTLNGQTVTDSGNSVNVDFGDNGQATLSLNYGDAGDIRLLAQTQSNQTGATLLGNSDSLNVRPEQLLLSHNTNNPQRAGDNFTLTIQALGTHAQVTPNYQPDDIQMQFERAAPAAGVEGILVFDTDQLTSETPAGFEDIDDNSLSFSAGTSSTTPYINEVGEFSLRVRDVNYSGHSISSQSLSLGRFIPAYFQVTAEEPELLDTCTDVTPFSYVGDAIGFDESNELQPATRIEARNMQDQITENYADTFWRLASWDIPAQISYSDNSYEPDNTLSANLDQQQLTQLEVESYDGVGFYRIDNATVTYEKGVTPLAPFDPSLAITISEAALTDSDGVCFRNSATDPCQPFTISDIGGAKLRYGRARLTNAYGQETEDLPVPLQLEYYDGSSWVLNSDDNCSAYNAGDLQLTTTLTTSASGAGVVTGGRPLVPMQGFVLEAAGETGEVELLWQNLPQWLQFDWQGDGTDLSNPTAVATFGQYRGNDRIIHWREVFE